MIRIRQMSVKCVSLLGWWALPTLLVGCIVGCAQSTDSRFDVPPEQRVVTPTTGGEQASQGSDVDVFVTNAPRGSTIPGAGGFDAGIAFGSIGQYPADVAGFGGDGQPFDRGQAGYLQITHLTVNTGPTTPSGATVTGSGTGTQTASATGTQTPTQTITPEVSAAAPIGLAAPGGLVDQNATATGRGTSDVAKTSTNSMTVAQLADLAQTNPGLAKSIFEQMFGTNTGPDAGATGSDSGDVGAITPDE